jgi:hypothetical protein
MRRRHAMKNAVLFLIIIISFSCPAYANDGYAGHTAEGLVFSKTDGISMEKETLSITEERIDVGYAFKNLTDKDIHATIAFPIPDIVCDWFTNPHYPDNFEASVNGEKIILRKETKAIVTDNYGEFWWQKKFTKGEDVTEVLSDNDVPLDCRTIAEFSKSYEELQNHKLSPVYEKLVKMGLACCDPLDDPPGVDYRTRIKYYWEQTFPAGQTLEINHSYSPSLGTWNGFYDSMTELKTQIDKYKPFYEKHFEKEAKADKFKYRTGFTYLDYTLVTANTWHGPINEFRLILPSTGRLIVTTMDGPFELVNGNLEIHKKNYSPAEDLTVYFFHE